MMEIKRKPFARLPGTLLATPCSLATVSGLMTVWDPSDHLIPFAVGHLPSGCLTLCLTIQRPPGRIVRKSPKAIDAPWNSAISGLVIPPSALFLLAVEFGCCVNICRAAELS